MDIQKRIGKKIKEARENKEYSQAEVAKKAGLGANYYACIERGEENPSLGKLESILKVLNLKVTIP